MPFLIVRNDIAKMETDAVVNSTHPGFFAPSGEESGARSSADGAEDALLKSGGPGLMEARRKLGTISVGDVRVTEGYDLPARYVFHTAGPVYRGGIFGEEKLLGSCFRAALLKADALGLSSVAFPLLSSGSFGYPKRKALDTAVREITSFLEDHEITAYLVVYDKEAYEISRRLRKDIKDYLSESLVPEMPAYAENALLPEALPDVHEEAEASFRRDEAPAPRKTKRTAKNAYPAAPRPAARAEISAYQQLSAAPGPSLRDFLDRRDESFSEMLLRKIDESGMTDVECYKRANIDRKLFSKIRTNADYRPKKTTAVAFAVALRLSLSETEELLRKAGFALSHASRFDLIIEYFIRAGKYDIYTINECLFEFDQPLLGA